MLGATGGTGRCLVSYALARGHAVTALIRREGPGTEVFGAVRVVVGDVLDPSCVEAIVADQDAVLWAIGPRSGGPAEHLCSGGTKNVLWAMQRAGVRRLICETAFGVGDSRWGGPYARCLRMVRRARVLDKERQEQRIRDSGVEWVIVRPTILTNGPRTGTYRVGADLHVGLFPRVARADVADFMLRQLDDTALLGQALGITA